MFENQMTSFGTPMPEDIKRQIAAMERNEDVRHLLTIIGEHLSLSGWHLYVAVEALRRCLELGYQLADEEKDALRIYPYLERMARSSLHVGLFQKFSVSRQDLVDAARDLPMEEQDRIANDRPVAVIDLDRQKRMIPPSLMTDWVVKQVFDRKQHKLRNDEEQYHWLLEQQSKRRLAQVSPEPGPFRFFKNRIEIVEPVSLSKRDVEAFLRHFRSE